MIQALTQQGIITGPDMPDKNIQTFLAGIIRESWNPASSRGLTPRVVTGWQDNEAFNEPHIVVTTPIDAPLRGGDTGFTGQSSSGSPVSRMLGQVVVQCVAHEGMTLLTTNPKDLVFDLKEEVKRIVGENTLNPNEHFDWLTFFSANALIDGVRRPIIYRYDCTIRYMYEDRIFF